MTRIVIPEFITGTALIQDRLSKLGDLKVYDDKPDPETWLKRCRQVDVICCGKTNLRLKVNELKDVFVSVPFVGVGWIDKNIIKKNNVTISYSPGCNKEAVSEWIVSMLINLVRRFPEQINRKEAYDKLPIVGMGLKGRKVTILGSGNVGSYTGDVLERFDMKVRYFKRGNDLKESVKDADVVINTLSTNPSTTGILDKEFFRSMKKGSFFISVTDTQQCNDDDVLEALNKGILAGVAHDSGGIAAWNINDPDYRKYLNHPNVIVTPHIAWSSDVADVQGNNIMIDNVEAFLRGTPQNIYK
jgi:phosphoglycerate dehydrogenase-like enzyme